MELKKNMQLLGFVCGVLLLARHVQATVVHITHGETAALSCDVNLTGELTLRTASWIKLGPPSVLVADLSGPSPAYAGRATVNSSGFLLLNNVQQADEGSYRCDASLSDFTALQSFETELKFANVSEVTVTEGSTTTLTCSTTDAGNPGATFSWLQNNISVPIIPRYTVSSDGATLTITGVDRADAATYGCRGFLGRYYSNITDLGATNYAPSRPTLTVSINPVTEGQGTVLTCSSTQYYPGPVTYSFATGSGQVTGDGSRITIDSSAGTLTLNPAQKHDAGSYTCVASNTVGSSGTSDAAAIVINCQVTGDGSGDIIHSGSGNSNNTAKENAASYTCVASNSVRDSDASDAVWLVVYYPPTQPVVTLTTPVTEGTTTTLTCSTTDAGNPAATLSWLQNNNPLPDLPRYTVSSDGTTLTITGVGRADAATYSCRAFNTLGQQTSGGVQLVVNYKPDLTVSATPSPVDEINSVTLTCTADSIPDVTSMNWTHVNSGRDIPGTLAGNVLTSIIQEVTYEERGNYTCMATNAIGSSRVALDLIVNSAPKPSQNLVYTRKTGIGVVTLAWTAGFNGGLETNHTVQYRPDGATDWVNAKHVNEEASQNRPEFTQTVELSEKGQYEIRIRAQNSKGAVYSNVIQVLVEGNQIMYGTLAITNVEYNNGVCEGELSNRIVTQVDSMFDSYKGYEGADITGCRSGSVLVDFEATVAQSESAAAQATYDENLADGQLGDFTVESDSSRISDTKPSATSGDSSAIIIIAVVVAAVVLIAVVGIVVLIRRRHDTRDKPPTSTPSSMELEQVAGNSNDGYESLRMPRRQKPDHTYQGLIASSKTEEKTEAAYEDVKPSSEFPRDQLNIKEELGQGEFGSVYKAEAWKISGSAGVTTVAVKELKGMTSAAAFFKELSMLKLLGTHPNVVSFLGCCTDAEPFYLLLEYVSGGSLQSNLRTSRTQQTYGNLHGGSKSLSSRDLTKFAWDVAKGMTFLSAKKILHRDLATRNVLVSADRTCKVSDFGFSREGDEYERTTKTRLPIRWMAPESLFHRKYTTKTDVWAFGVLLWEIVTLGATPYPGMSKQEVMDGVQQGYRMEKPPLCGDKLYTLMLSCWDADPARRPEFQKIQRTLDLLMETEHDNINLPGMDEKTYTSLPTASDEKY